MKICVCDMETPNFNFELSTEDIELIQYSLGKLIMSKICYTDSNDSDQQFDEIKKIQELLSKIHNQKIWYKPRKTYVSG